MKKKEYLLPKNSVFADCSPEDLTKRKKSAQPPFMDPMLATLTDTYFSSDEWIFEHKFDGERCLVFKKNGKVTLKSRNDKIKNRAYPELVAAFEKQAADDFIIDGEIISSDKEGRSDFQQLQQRINLTNESEIKVLETKVTISFCIFDVMYTEGFDVRNLPLTARKSILKKLLNYKDLLVYTPHRTGDGLSFFKEACKLHWEGLIAKKSNSTYVGKRSPNWLKFKCIMKQELVIVGYTEPKGSRTDFGALLVGYYMNEKLIYAGKVGTGYSEDILQFLGKKLRALEIKSCPLSTYDDTTKGVHWVKPQLVAEFQFANWTKDGMLRVGRYKGLRDDKSAQDVVREKPQALMPPKT